MDFELWKSTKKRFFCWRHFFHLCRLGGRNIKDFKFFRKNSKVFRRPKMIWNGFCAMKEHSKMIFCWPQFAQLSRVGNAQVLKWSAITQTTVRSSFYWQYFCKLCSMMWKACLYFLYTIVTMYVSTYVRLLAWVQIRNSCEWITNWVKWMNENSMYKNLVFIIFMYKIIESMSVCIFN